jgi:cbb3-type cytochrome oxidase maturation protein
MSVIIILILASLGVAATFLGGFIWAVRSGQFEDTLTPSMRILAEEPPLQSAEAAVLTATNNQSRTTNHHEQRCLDSRET